MKLIKQFRDRNQKGSVLVEVALVVTSFMFLMGAVLDLSNYLHVRSKIQHAVSQSARYAVTGNQLVDPNDSSSTLTRDASIIYLLEKYTGLKFKSDQVDIYSVAPDGSLRAGPGVGGDVVLVRVRYDVGLITPGLQRLFPNGRARIQCSARFRNEQFSSLWPDLTAVTGIA